MNENEPFDSSNTCSVWCGGKAVTAPVMTSFCPLDTIPPEETGLFGRPLFEDPSARALSRVGVVDVGSNSVRMVVFDGAARSPAYFYNEKIMCGLGKGLAETGVLDPQGRRRALAALKRFSLLAKGMGIESLIIVATAAVREARDLAARLHNLEANGERPPAVDWSTLRRRASGRYLERTRVGSTRDRWTRCRGGACFSARLRVAS